MAEPWAGQEAGAVAGGSRGGRCDGEDGEAVATAACAAAGEKVKKAEVSCLCVLGKKTEFFRRGVLGVIRKRTGIVVNISRRWRVWFGVLNSAIFFFYKACL